jgi:hypothetical protein
VHERGGHGGVDPAGQAAQDPLVADPPADERDLLVDDAAGVPVGRSARRRDVEEVLEHLLAKGGVQDLGVPLHAIQPTGGVLEGGDRGAAGGRGRR